MARTITGDPASFPGSITVPEGGDTHTTAAEVVAAIAQALMDRTTGTHSRAIFKDVVNAALPGFGIEFASASDEVAPLIFDGAPANKWRLQAKWELAGDAPWLRLYSGTATAGNQGQLALVVNALWVPGSTQWLQDNSTADSVALFLDLSNHGLVISRQLAGSPAWATWPVDDGTLTTSIINCDDVNVSASGAFNYGTTRTMTTLMGCGSPHAGGHNGGNGALITDGSLSYAYIDLRFPPNWGTTAGAIEVIYQQTTSAPNIFRLTQRTLNFATPAAASETYLVSDTGNASTGYKKAVLSLTGLTWDPATKEYRLRWEPGNAADTFEGWRIVSWVDRGPMNNL